MPVPHRSTEPARAHPTHWLISTQVLNLGTSSVGWAREAHETCGGAGVAYLDAPVSGGPEGAAAGSLAVFLGGDEAAVRRAAPVLDAIAARFARLGPAGAGAGAKLVNQALVAANAQGAAEGLALAEALGCDLEQLLPLLDGAWAASTMLARSGARRLGADPARLAFESSAAPLRNFAKDLALVRDAAAGRGLDLPAVRVAAETVAAAAARGAADCDWAAVPSFLARPTTANELARAAPPFSAAVPTAEALRAALAAQASPSLPVVDDDPTGTQTVHGVAVRADWADLSGELRSDKSCFYLLANTRALDEAAAVARNREIGRELRRGGPRLVVSRSDSTLRGHFPAEVDALADGLGWRRPLVLVAPQFFGGGRVTADGVHYVLGAPADGDRPATPAGETEFARDRAFGYRRSRLAEWVAEKTRGSADYAHTWHLSLHAIRGGVRAVQDAFEAALLDETVRAVCVDGLEDRDMLVVASGLKAAMAAQRGALHARGGVVVRSAGSAVAALTGMPPKPFLGREALSPSSGGGLVVVGSYTQKTSAQLAELRRRCGWLDAVEVDVGEVLADAEGAVARASAAAAAALGAGRSACVFTSRRVQQDDGSGGLVIGAKVNEALCAVAARVVERATPAFVVAKGGITSNDVAVKSLGVRRADVLGQVIAGVPAWRLGRESRLPGASYVVFPGNVGDADDLANVVETVAGASGAGVRRGSIARADARRPAQAAAGRVPEDDLRRGARRRARQGPRARRVQRLHAGGGPRRRAGRRGGAARGHRAAAPGGPRPRRARAAGGVPAPRRRRGGAPLRGPGPLRGPRPDLPASRGRRPRHGRRVALRRGRERAVDRGGRGARARRGRLGRGGARAPRGRGGRPLRGREGREDDGPRDRGGISGAHAGRRPRGDGRQRARRLRLARSGPGLGAARRRARRGGRRPPGASRRVGPVAARHLAGDFGRRLQV